MTLSTPTLPRPASNKSRYTKSGPGRGSGYNKKRPPASGKSELLEDWLPRGDFAAEIYACERTVARMQKQGLPYTVIAGKHYIHKTRGLEWIIEHGTAA